MSLTNTAQGTEVGAQTSTSSEFVYSVNTNMPQSSSVTFPTAGKYVDRDIKFQINVPGVVIPTPASGTSTFYITIGNATYFWRVDSDGNVWVDADGTTTPIAS